MPPTANACLKWSCTCPLLTVLNWDVQVFGNECRTELCIFSVARSTLCVWWFLPGRTQAVIYGDLRRANPSKMETNNFYEKKYGKTYSASVHEYANGETCLYQVKIERHVLPVQSSMLNVNIVSLTVTAAKQCVEKKIIFRIAQSDLMARTREEIKAFTHNSSLAMEHKYRIQCAHSIRLFDLCETLLHDTISEWMLKVKWGVLRDDKAKIAAAAARFVRMLDFRLKMAGQNRGRRFI